MVAPRTMIRRTAGFDRKRFDVFCGRVFVDYVDAIDALHACEIIGSRRGFQPHDLTAKAV